jgi:hypothetical protein
VGVRVLKGEGGLNVSVDEVRGGESHEMEVDEGAVGVAVGGGA